MNKNIYTSATVSCVAKDGEGTVSIMLDGIPEGVKEGDTVQVKLFVNHLTCPKCGRSTPDKKTYEGSRLIKCEHCGISFGIREG